MVMTIEALILWLVIGAVVAGLIMVGYCFGLIGNLMVGIVGAVLVGWLWQWDSSKKRHNS
jgi:uncharacterized membrane protein YeaQ/YmgE (transglycosylase-associated protein family)